MAHLIPDRRRSPSPPLSYASTEDRGPLITTSHAWRVSPEKPRPVVLYDPVVRQLEPPAGGALDLSVFVEELANLRAQLELNENPFESRGPLR